VLDFFGQIDPARSHDINRRLYKPGTGLWFLRSEDFKRWRQDKNATLWIHGIPGAGKMILSSLIIEGMKRPPDEDNALTFFYCDSKDPTTQDPFAILCSTAKQLAMQDERAFEELRRLHKSCNPKRKASTQPKPE
jgi:hypothetical protein